MGALRGEVVPSYNRDDVSPDQEALMFGFRDESALGAGAISKSWRVRAATVLVVCVVLAGIGFAWGRTLEALLLGFAIGLVVGISCVVMGEASMDTGAYKHPEKYF